MRDPRTDDRLEEFHLWAGVEKRQRGGFAVAFVFCAAAVVAVLIAVSAAGWL
jgi:hypothetical protein